MIRIFKGDIEKVEKEVNDFMKGLNEDIPVRTNMANDGDYVATVFYKNNGDETIPEEDVKPEMRVQPHKDTTTEQKKGKVGAAWKDKMNAGKLSVKIDNIDGYHKIEESDLTDKGAYKEYTNEANGKTTRFVKNSYKKKGDRLPDYVIYDGE